MSNQAKPPDEPTPCDPESVGDPYPVDPDADPDSEPPWRPYERFFAWCPPSDRMDALLATLSAFGTSGKIQVFDYYDATVPESERANTIADATAVLRSRYARGWVRARIAFSAPSGHTLDVWVGADSDSETAPLPIWLDAGRSQAHLYSAPIPHPKHRDWHPSAEVEAALAYTTWVTDAYEIFARLCTISPTITVGGCGGNWGLPTTGSGSYHADGYVARDLARTWWHLVHPGSPEQTSGYSLADLRAVVEASPQGQGLSPAMGVWLTREEVLAAMDVPKEKLLAALQVCAAEASPEWRAIENDINRIRQSFEYREGADVEWTSFGHEHATFLKKHAPFVVKRLDTGAVVLLAYPWRNLWPLWSDALRLLGIRP